VLLVGNRAGPAASAALGRLHELPPERIGEIDDGMASRFDAAIVATDDTLRTLRRVRAADRALQLIAVVEAGERAAVERALLFTPGLGEVWLVDADGLDASLTERAAAVTAARRGYSTVRQRAASDLALIEPHPSRRAVVSDAYLAALLRGIPDAVISLDEDGRVLTWNAAAERLLGIDRQAAIGRGLEDLVALHDEARGEPRADGAPSRVVRFRRGDGTTGFGEFIRMPIVVDGRSITAVVLHDETALRRSQAELEQQADVLEEQALELESINEELMRQGDDLRRALASRSRFYAAMSHELRTPINAIIGYNALLLEGIYGELHETQRDALLRAQRAANHLLELVNDVLDLAKVEAGRLEIVPGPIRLPDLLADLLDTVSALAREHETPLHIEGPVGSHEMLSDPRRVRQILLNLLSNAIKYGRGKPVIVRWRATADGGARIDIADAGPGIAPEDRERIFQEFEQVRTEGASAEATAGTGLGLAISARLAALLDARILLDSEPGRGSTFSLLLPGAPPPHPQ
jgi:PAS domain S-box-containing protein